MNEQHVKGQLQIHFNIHQRSRIRTICLKQKTEGESVWWDQGTDF
jgi:hypothetical protein